jgi:hypothetical protein
MRARAPEAGTATMAWSGGADDEQRTEQSKVTIRWIVVTVALAAVAYMRRTGTVDTPWAVIIALTTAITALNLGFSLVLRRGAVLPGGNLRWLRYVTTGSDLVMISVLVAYSGGSASPFYYVYFIVLVSNAVRYGMAMAIFVAIGYNVAYVAVLLARPVADLTSEGAKILAFWGVAFYAGYLAARFQRQTRVLQAYEETILSLRARLGERAGPGGAA